MKLNSKWLLGLSALMAMTSCIDDNYDLSDIDTTSELKVKDLVLPVQLDPVVLNDIIDVKEGDQIKEVTLNGETFYAIEEIGEFESDPIHVNDFTASDIADLNPTQATFRLGGASGVKKNSKRHASGRIYYLVKEVVKKLDYEASDIDGSVRDLTKVTFRKNVNFTMTIQASGINSTMAPQLENLKLILPTGLVISGITAPGYTFSPSDYVPSTGELNISKITMNGDVADIVISSSAIDLEYAPDVFTYNPSTDSGKFSLNSDFTIREANLSFGVSDDLVAQLPEEINFTVNYDVTNMEVNSILGSIAYDLSGTGLAIDPIELNDLPDFLSDDETNLILANPQIYLNLNNPIGSYGIGYQSGLDIIATRDGVTEAFTLPSPIRVAGADRTFNYLLAPNPDKVTNIPSEYASGLHKETYPTLGRILSGNGLPQMLDIELLNPQIPEQRLTAPFELGTDLEGMKGTYRFIAPLALQGDSRIIYNKTEDGWWSEDLADLTITTLQLKAVATSDLPLGAVLAVYPLDKDGNQIKGLDIESVELPANANNTEILFLVNGEIRNLDGVIITATVKPDDSEEALAPDQFITLNNIRVMVSGNYTRKF